MVTLKKAKMSWTWTTKALLLLCLVSSRVAKTLQPGDSLRHVAEEVAEADALANAGRQGVVDE